VEAVVEGSVLREGVRVGITAQLIEVSTDQTLWADRYERDLTSVLALQGEIARAIAGEIQVTLTPEEAFRLAARREVGLDPDVSRVGVEWALFLRDVSVTVATGSSTRAPPVDAVPQAEQLWVRDKTAMNPPRTPSRQGITQQQRRPLLDARVHRPPQHMLPLLSVLFVGQNPAWARISSLSNTRLGGCQPAFPGGSWVPGLEWLKT
jgi:hypothetical protein